MIPSDFYVYRHLRKDTGQIFYVGKGRKRRAFTKDSRPPAWSMICAEAGGFTVEFVAQGLTSFAAYELEKQETAAHGNLLVNIQNMRTPEKKLLQDELLMMLRENVAIAGNQKACAKNLGVCAPYISECLNGTLNVGKKLEAALRRARRDLV